ncbi:MAG: hypothetical protein WD960_04480 [Gemmatimonadota bacterium]
MSRSPTPWWAAGSIFVLVAACVGGDAKWTEEDWQSIYSVALEAVRHSRADPLVVDARSRFLVPNGSGELQMGEYNRWGDPSLAAAISEDPAASPCRVGPDRVCDRGMHDRFTLISEPHPIGRREAVLLASRVVVADGVLSSTGLALQVRYANGAWRVTRMWEDDSVRLPPGSSP